LIVSIKDVVSAVWLIWSNEIWVKNGLHRGNLL
jgi:hypothetical protein